MRRTAVTFALAAALAAAPAVAAPPAAATPVSTDLVIDASPVLGSSGSVAQGWNEVVVVVQNNGGKPARGRATVSTSQLGREKREFRATAPFSVGAGAAVTVRVPALVALYGDLLVEVLDEEGRSLSQKTFPSFMPTGPTLLDVSEASRLRGAINEAAVTPLFVTGGGSTHGAAPALAVGSPRHDPATGDPILPDRAALYTTQDAVLMRSDVLARLAGAELDALAGYVLAGGTLAVAVVRPEDVRHPTLAAFAGGSVSRQGVFAATLADLTLPVPSTGLSSSSKLIPRAREPSGDVAETLAGYAGGNLHGSLYGSSAAYGLGEVHLLAFDPTSKPAVDDPWAQARMVDLTRRAFDRRSTQVFRPGADPHATSYGRVRQQLDPNESSRWAIGAAALLLVVYAILAGPVNFSLAQKAGRPLRALRRLPVFAAVAFALVLGVGVAAKGVAGRARHLTLVEAGAGMSKGSARRFRGFYASRAKELTVRTTDAGSVVATAVSDAAERRESPPRRSRRRPPGGRGRAPPGRRWWCGRTASPPSATASPWSRRASPTSRWCNRAGRDLRSVILRAPGGEAYYFPRLEDGGRVTTTAGTKMSADPDGRSWETSLHSPYHAGGVDLHHLYAHALKPLLDRDAPGLSDAWWAVGDAAGEYVDWFPDGVPVLIGQLDGGEGRLSDAGLRLDSDRLLVRVVGWGGRP